MKQIKIITLFPQFLNIFIETSIIKRAIEKQLVNIDIIDLRKFGEGKNLIVDDYPCGGGDGMVLKVNVLYDAIEFAKSNKDSYVVLLSPQGKKFNQQKAYELQKLNKQIILVSGHYEGFDERISHYVDEEISIGDYVLTGGEIPSMVITDAIVRLVPGVIKKSSHLNESFAKKYLDYSVYTRPINFNSHCVPEVLLSGHHQLIEKYRQKSAFINTYNKRKDLIDFNNLTEEENIWINSIKDKSK